MSCYARGRLEIHRIYIKVRVRARKIKSFVYPQQDDASGQLPVQQLRRGRDVRRHFMPARCEFVALPLSTRLTVHGISQRKKSVTKWQKMTSRRRIPLPKVQ